MQPCLILTCGTVASGKSTMTQNVIELIEKKSNQKLDFVSFQIDELVVNDALYKKQIDKLIDKHEYDTSNNNLENASDELNDEYVKEFNNVRLKTGCKTIEDNVKKVPCFKYLNDNIQKAFKENKNIVIEFNYTMLKALKQDMKQLPSHYKIIIAYTLVDYCKLIERNMLRSYNTMRQYLKNKQTNQAPRLAKLNKNKVVTVKNKLKKIITCFIGDKKAEVCNFLNISEKGNLLLYDNNGTNMKLIYDNETDKLTKKEIYSLIDKHLVVQRKPCFTKKRENKP